MVTDDIGCRASNQCPGYRHGAIVIAAGGEPHRMKGWVCLCRGARTRASNPTAGSPREAN